MSGIVDAEFDRIAAMLGVPDRTGTYAFADAFWSELSRCTTADGIPDGLAASIEQAIVWRVLSWRALSELGNAPLFQKRDKGTASGTSVAHPAVQTLAYMYENLRRSMTEIRERGGHSPDESTMGLAERMRPILEETEVAFDELLGPGGFPGRASTKGLPREEDSRE